MKYKEMKNNYIRQTVNELEERYMIKDRLKYICDVLDLDDSKIINCYSFGSRVYQTDNDKSDFDYIIVYDDEILLSNNKNIQRDKSFDLVDIDSNINVKLYSHNTFIELINSHRIDVLECLFLEDKYILKQTIDYIDYFTLDLDTLRRSISAICSNSYVKCKKKLKQGDDYIGKKSMFHSLRIAHYGIQIAKHNKILDYIYLDDKYTTKSLFNEIMHLNAWEEINDKYKYYANQLRTDFRLVAPLKLN